MGTRSGLLGANSSQTFTVVWTPSESPSEDVLEDTVKNLIIDFPDYPSDVRAKKGEGDEEGKQPQLVLTLRGRVQHEALWVQEERLVDFGICWIDRLYQKSFIVLNRSSRPILMNALVPKEVSKFIEVFPKSALLHVRIIKNFNPAVMVAIVYR